MLEDSSKGGSKGGRVVGLVLAGGESRRMGFPKLTLRLKGQTLLARALMAVGEVCDERVVVVGAHAAHYAPEAAALGATVVRNEDWQEGLASSLRAGIAALPDGVSAVLVVLPDQPYVGSEHLGRLIGEFRRSAVPLVFSRYKGALGAPAVIHRSLFARVMELRGDTGARALVRHVKRVGEVPLATPFDVDTPDEARRLLG